jgi:hypothetical protein
MPVANIGAQPVAGSRVAMISTAVAIGDREHD